MTEVIMRLCSAGLCAKFIYGSLTGSQNFDDIIMSAVLAAWADVIHIKKRAKE